MKTIARVYDTYGQARQVVADLEASGVAASVATDAHICTST